MRPVSPDLAENYYAKGYWRREDLWTTIALRAAAAPDRAALVCGDDSVTFAEMIAQAEKLGRGLSAKGIRPGDIVVVHARNGIDTVVAMLGCVWLGAVLTPLPPMFSEAQVAAIAESAGARAIFCLGNTAEIARAATGARQAAAMSLIVSGEAGSNQTGITSLSDLIACGTGAKAEPRTAIDPDALAMLVYSSGTTGAPKGVVHSGNTVRYAIEKRSQMHDVDADDICLVVCQFGFVGSVVFGLLAGPIVGATSVILPAWDPAAALGLIDRHRISYGLFMPTHVHDLLHAPELATANLSSLRRAAMGGMPEPRRREVMQELCPLPLPGYGMSECLGNATCAPEDSEEARLTRDGRPYAGTEIRIVAEDGTACPPGVIGEIQLRGPSRCLGYYRAEALTDAAFTHDGFFRSGDRGSLDDQGYLSFAGREKDIIRRGGVTIVPGEIEAVLTDHPAIRHAAIVGLPDARYGEIACACIIPEGDTPPDLATLTAYLAERGVARYQWPEQVAVFDEFPRTPSLKIQKPALAKALMNRMQAATT